MKLSLIVISLLLIAGLQSQAAISARASCSVKYNFQEDSVSETVVFSELLTEDHAEDSFSKTVTIPTPQGDRTLTIRGIAQLVQTAHRTKGLRFDLLLRDQAVSHALYFDNYKSMSQPGRGGYFIQAAEDMYLFLSHGQGQFNIVCAEFFPRE